MPEFSVLIPFLVAVVAIQLSPGPDMMMVIARGIGQGRKVALTCVAGISAAALIQIPALALGVATLFEKSEIAYAVLKNIGAAYLIYLGVRFFLSSSKAADSVKNSVTSARAAFFQGFWGNLANPKSLVFLIAFLPQFVDSTRENVAIQLFVLGLIHKSVGLIIDGSVAILSGSSGNWLRKNPGYIKWQEKLVGTILIGLGLRLAFDGDD